jgi:DMSO/TMAO reductase YedYZ molybdopterin-dependent catalytic subunit
MAASFVPTDAPKRGQPTDGPITSEELQLAFRDHGMPLEALRYALTPTGLHYLVLHWDVPDVEAASLCLKIGGRVQRPIDLDLAGLRRRPTRTIAVTLECAGNGRGLLTPRPVSVPWHLEAIGTAAWTGTPLWPILEEAGIEDDAVDVVFRGRDHGIQGGVEQAYERALSVEEARRPDVLLAWAMNGRPLEPQHGSPLRLIVPAWYGMASVKWLESIEALATTFGGYQQAIAYRYQRDADDPGVPVSRIRVRALMIPPGMPDAFSRRRVVDAGTVRLYGRSWSGTAPIVRVQVGVDGAFAEASLEPTIGPFAWRGWSFTWEATPGEHELTCRATDAGGAVQPEEMSWNYQGMGNNGAQRVPVTVR